MLPGSRSRANPCCSGIPRVPVGILTPIESHLRPSRLPHFCPTRDATVGPADPPPHVGRSRRRAAGGSCCRPAHSAAALSGSVLRLPSGLIYAHPTTCGTRLPSEGSHKRGVASSNPPMPTSFPRSQACNDLLIVAGTCSRARRSRPVPLSSRGRSRHHGRRTTPHRAPRRVPQGAAWSRGWPPGRGGIRR